MRDLESSLAQLRGAWMAGRSALEFCPAEWRSIANGAHAECALLALASHATAVLFRPAPAAPLEPRPLLPALALPTLPAALRPRVRRIMAQRSRERFLPPLINLVAARGFTMHPDDWLPHPSDDWVAPDLYAPWLDWVCRQFTAASDLPLTLETYGEWSPTERWNLLFALRRRDPALARAIIAAKAPTEPADRRIELIAILEENLSEADAAFLESLAQNRSHRLRDLAAAYLARLGRPDPLAAEFAGMVKIGKVGLARRRTSLAIKTLKTAAQNARRWELFRLVTFGGLARALGVSEQQILETAPTGARADIEAFVEMVAATGSGEARRRLLDVLLDDTGQPLVHVGPLGERLSPAERRAVLPRMLKRETEGFMPTLMLMACTLGEAPLAMLRASPAYAALMQLAGAAARGDETYRPHIDSLEPMLNTVTLLADAAAATGLIVQLAAAGLSPADPRLDLLHLNAALHPETRP